MPSEKLLTPVRARLALLGCAVAIAGCGSVRVQPTTSSGSSKLASRGKLDNQLTNVDNHLACLQAAHLPVQVISPDKLQIGALPAGPTIVFTPSAAVGQADQIVGSVQGAEVIGSALLYPNQGSSSELSGIEDCLDQGVQG